jgi:heterodisulfide reductase subunit A
MLKPAKIVFESLDEMPYAVISQGTTEFNRTGTWRYLKPVGEEKLPPCQNACPAGNNIAVTLSKIREGDFRKAWEVLSETTPFPQVCGRVCPHPCETYCSRGEFDEAISIRDIENFLGEEAIKGKWSFHKPHQTKEKKVAVIGSGPAGLSCAYQLARLGYPVAVYEATSRAGGLLRWGIPEYRLPREILDNEIDGLLEFGIEIRTNSSVNDPADLLKQGYSALFAAIGAGQSQTTGNLLDEKTKGVWHALDFLKQVNSGTKVNPGARVVVIGGGNAAIDSARVSLHLGAKDVTVVYRRSRHEMPAIASEVDEAGTDGVQFVFLAGPRKIVAANGLVKGLSCVRMELGKPDAGGRRSPIPVEGSEFTIDADDIILAIGQTVDKSGFAGQLSFNRQGTISVDPATSQTNVQGIFAGGDAVNGPATVADAIGSGRRAALAIDGYLSGRPLNAASKPTQVVKYEDLNLDYFKHAARQSQIQDAILAGREADRCFSCGVCSRCDNCLIYCPDIAINKNHSSYQINYDYCKGCGICSQECPCNYISMMEEERC